MFDRKRKTIFLLSAFILCFIIAFFRFTWNKKSEKEEYPITRVSILLPHQDDGYWELIGDGIKEAYSEIGEEYHIDIKIFTPQLNYNISQMIDLMKQQIASQVDVLIVQGNDNPDYKNTLLKAQEQGIRIICLDTDMTDFPEHLFIGTDSYEAGYIIGEQLVKLTNGVSRVAIISGEKRYQNLELRLQGLRDAIKDNPGIEIVDVKYDNYDGLTVMKLYRELKGSADTIVFLEGTGGKTLSTTFKERDSSYEYLLGFDAFENIPTNVMDGVILQDTHQMGYRAIEEIVKYIVEGKYSQNQIFTDIHWVTNENYKEVIK